jgi:hypothetical protein
VRPRSGVQCTAISLLRRRLRGRCSQVYLASASPPVRHANVYGVDMPTRREFVAYNLSEEEICTVRAAPAAELGLHRLRVVATLREVPAAAPELLRGQPRCRACWRRLLLLRGPACRGAAVAQRAARRLAGAGRGRGADG